MSEKPKVHTTSEGSQYVDPVELLSSPDAAERIKALARIAFANDGGTHDCDWEPAEWHSFAGQFETVRKVYCRKCLKVRALNVTELPR